MQNILATQFNDSTILTIAHRLRTVIKYNKIMYIQEGRISEFEDPHILLQDSQSKFYQLVEEGGEEFLQEMKQLAKEGYEQRVGKKVD